jgi:hypothetical protein
VVHEALKGMRRAACYNRMEMAKRWLASMGMICALALGCAVPKTTTSTTPAAPAATAAAAEEDKPLPPMLEALKLSAAQRREILALREQLKRDLEPIIDAGRDFASAVAVAARTCKPDSPFIPMEAEYTVRVGEQVRGRLLDAVDKFHRILTPAQRQELSKSLLAAADRSEDERDDRDDSRTRSIGDELDLSVSQTVALLVRVQALRSSFEEKVAPWRDHYDSAIVAFARDDFEARKQPIAEAPVVELATGIVRDGLRVLIPVLEPKQCDALGRFISDKIEESKQNQSR